MSKYLLDLTKEFAGKRAIVTGGSRGIGAAVAQRLLDGGATEVVTARNTHAQTPQGAAFVSGDTRTLEGAQKVAREAVAKVAPNAKRPRPLPNGLAMVSGLARAGLAEPAHPSCLSTTSNQGINQCWNSTLTRRPTA